MKIKTAATVINNIDISPGIKRVPFSFTSEFSWYTGKQINVIAGRPAHGKTTFALWEAVRLSEQKKKDGIHKNSVLFISLEMTAEQLLKKMRNPKELDLKGLKFADDTHKPEDILVLVKEDVEDETIVVIDHINHINWRSPRTEIPKFVKQLQLIAEEKQLTLLIVSQLNRAVENRGKQNPQNWAEMTLKIPKPADLRESGELEQLAALIVFPFYSYQYWMKSDSPNSLSQVFKNRFSLSVGKNRFGSLNLINFAFYPETGEFELLYIGV